MSWEIAENFTLGGNESGTYWYRWPDGQDMGIQIAYAHPDPIVVCKLHISDLSMERTSDGGITYWVTVTNDSPLLAVFRLMGGGVV